MKRVEWQLDFSPFLRNVISTTVTAAFTVISGLLVVRFLAQGLGAEEFGAYSIARRFVSTAFPLSVLSMHIALPRYIGKYQGQRYLRDCFLISGTMLGLGVTSVLLLLSATLSDQGSLIVFGDDQRFPLFFGSLFMLCGYVIYMLLYSYYRGMEWIGRANLWQLGVMALGPVLLSKLYAKQSNSVMMILLLGSLFWISAPILAYYSVTAWNELDRSFDVLWRTSKELFKYGLPRIPSGLAKQMLLSLGPMLAPSLGSLKGAGYLILAQAILRVVESGADAFGVVALPRIANLMGRNQEGFVSARLADVVALAFQLGLFASLHLYLWVDLIIKMWVGDEYLDAIPIVRITLMALVPYASFGLLRSAVDAIEVKPINMINSIAALVITICVIIVTTQKGLGIIGLAIGTTAGLSTLGYLTILFVRHRCRFDFREVRLVSVAVANIMIFLPAVMVHKRLSAGTDLLLLVPVIVLVEGGLLISYIGLLWKWKVRWTRELYKRIQVNWRT